MTETTDVTGTLAELERKLRELERELTSLGRRRADTAETLQEPSQAPSPTLGGRLVDEAIEVTRPTGGEQPTSAVQPPMTQRSPAAQPSSATQPTSAAERPLAAQPPWAAQPPVTGQPSDAEQAVPRAATPPARPSRPLGIQRTIEPTEQGEAPRPSEAQLAGLAELRRFRDRLERFAKELAVEYDTLLGRVMTGLFSTSQSAAAVAPGVPVPPAQPAAAAAAGVPPAQPAAAAMRGAPSSQPSPRMASVPVAPPVAAPPQPPSEEESLFEGHIELGAGPFYDIGALSAFERRLASLPNVISASVRRFEASHAVVDVRLSAPVALVGELRRTTDTDFSVREVASGRILLTFDDV
jgi:hypothetical protein